MRRSLLIFFCLANSVANGQCLTTFSKLVPDQTKTFAESFGSSFAVYGDILAVGAAFSDTLATRGGVVYLYKQLGTNWTKVGILFPSNVSSEMRFGTYITMTENYIIVSCWQSTALYVFRKPPSGWQTAAESAILQVPGANFALSRCDISSDEQTIVATDAISNSGAFYVFHKQASQEWSSASITQKVENPDKNNGVTLFGVGGVKFLSDGKIACATSAGFSSSVGSIYIFKDTSGAFSSYQLEAKLTDNYQSSYGPTFAIHPDGIFKSDRSGKIIFYPNPTNGVWQNNSPFCEFALGTIDGMSINTNTINYESSGNELYFFVELSDKTGRLFSLSKTGTDWCSGTSKAVVYQELTPPQTSDSFFYRSLTVYKNEQIVYSWTVDMESKLPYAVGVFTKQSSGAWNRTTISKTISEANGFNFGRSLWHNEDYLFITARDEKSFDRKPRGAVHVYNKQNGKWVVVNKLYEPPQKSDDRNYGSGIAGHGQYVAIGAFGYQPSKIYIYKAGSSDFSNPTLQQTLVLPTDRFIQELGNLAMENEWLVVPVSTNDQRVGPRNVLFFYKRDANETWNLDHELGLGVTNVIIKRVPYVDMENGVIVSSDGYNKVGIIEFDNQQKKWTWNHTLTASDPDNDLIFQVPGWPGIFADASFFGASVELDGDKIFVGAPGKNDLSINDVGAIYVYKRDLRRGWSSGTESSKILPVNKLINTYFGSSLDVLNNTMVVGAASLDRPGKAFVVQTQDYFWRNTIQLLELSGDTFVTDYFGYEVSLDKDNFFITSPIETNKSGANAGTVYVTIPPPLVKLEPPICITETAYNLFGYPFQGSWTGPGITDALKGTFSPQLAGAGIHRISYKTPNCLYEGNLQIEVSALPLATPEGNLQTVICDVGKTATLLSVVDQANVQYKWSFQEKVGDNFVLASNETTRQRNTNQAGRHRIDIFNASCSVFTIFTVEKEKLAVEIAPFPEVCDDSRKTVTLQSNYAGGVWTFKNNINPNVINAVSSPLPVENLSNGIYTVSYSYTSINQCIYNSERVLLVNRIPALGLSRSGNLCTDGNVTLSVNGQTQGLRFVWLYKTSNGDSILSNTTSGNLVASKNGLYSLYYSNSKDCKSPTSFITINDNFNSKILPDGDPLINCPLLPLLLTVQSNGFKQKYTWIYKKTLDTNTEIVGNESQYEVKSSGYYSVRVTQGGCTFHTPFKKVNYSGADSLFVPNVFTPNGDTFNDVFKIFTSYHPVQLKVINRYGSEVFSGDGSTGWNGGESPAAVYFWFASFVACDDQKKTIKGFVQLIR